MSNSSTITVETQSIKSLLETKTSMSLLGSRALNAETLSVNQLNTSTTVKTCFVVAVLSLTKTIILQFAVVIEKIV